VAAWPNQSLVLKDRRTLHENVVMHLLLIEDDLDLGRALLQALRAEGFSVEWLRRLAEVPLQLSDQTIGCVLLDVNLPDGSGLDQLVRWRSKDVAVPVIVITARTALEDRLRGLDGGADDYIVKPFATSELVSRIHAVRRRYAQQASELWTFGALEIEPRRHGARLAGTELELSPREFRLLLELAREPGRVVPKGQLAQRLEPLGEPVNFSTIEMHLSNLRRKIGPKRIRTVRGVGYLFEP
jgi:two-component system response regulator QseB